MHYHTPSNCPVCSQTLDVTRLRCRNCASEITGQFALCRFCLLDNKQLQFVETFLRCRGSIKEVEKILGISYPTVRNMLESALSALGLSDKDMPAAARRDDKDEIVKRPLQDEPDVEEVITARRNKKHEPLQRLSHEEPGVEEARIAQRDKQHELLKRFSQEEPGAEESVARRDEKHEILKRLSHGELSPEEAIAALNKISKA
jgi:hypothetical protein